MYFFKIQIRRTADKHTPDRRQKTSYKTPPHGFGLEKSLLDPTEVKITFVVVVNVGRCCHLFPLKMCVFWDRFCCLGIGGRARILVSRDETSQLLHYQNCGRHMKPNKGDHDHYRLRSLRH